MVEVSVQIRSGAQSMVKGLYGHLEGGGVNMCYFKFYYVFNLRLDTKVNSLDMQLR